MGHVLLPIHVSPQLSNVPSAKVRFKNTIPGFIRVIRFRADFLV